MDSPDTNSEMTKIEPVRTKINQAISGNATAAISRRLSQRAQPVLSPQCSFLKYSLIGSICSRFIKPRRGTKGHKNTDLISGFNSSLFSCFFVHSCGSNQILQFFCIFVKSSRCEPTALAQHERVISHWLSRLDVARIWLKTADWSSGFYHVRSDYFNRRWTRINADGIWFSLLLICVHPCSSVVADSVFFLRASVSPA